MVTDVDDPNAPKEDLPEASQDALEIATDLEGKPVVGGDPEAEEAPFSKTGWAPRFGWPSDEDEAESMLDHSTWVESRLPDHLYGGR